MYDFLHVISTLYANFSRFWHFTCNNKKNLGTPFPSARDIAKEWRDHIRSQKHIPNNVFNVTL